MDDQFSTFQLREARHQAESSNKSGYYRSVDQKSTTKLPLDSRARREFRSISRKSIFLIIANNIIPRRGRMEPRSSTSFHLQPLFETIRKFSETKEGSRVNVDYAIIRRNRVHESTARAPPKYAFRPKDPHFEIDPHDFPGIYIHIYTSNIRNLDSFRLFSPRFDSRVPDRLIELGRREMLRGNFSNRAAIERGKHATPTTRRKISIPSLPCFLPPSVCVFLREFYFYLYSFSTFSNCIYIEISFPISIFFF